MSTFLNKIKEVEKNKEKVNPFAKTSVVAETTSSEIKPNPFAKKNPFLKNKTVEKEEPKEEVKQEKPSEEVPKKKVVSKKEESIKKEEANPKEENKSEEEVKTKEEAKADEEPKTEDTTKVEEEKPVVEKKETKKKTTRRKKTEVVEKQETVSVSKIIPVEIPRTEIDYAEAIQAIQSEFVDENWLVFRQDIENKINSIKIEPDINSVTLTQALAELDAVRQEIWIQFIDIKTLYDQLTSEKPEGLIERIKRLNSNGSNDAERRQSGIYAVMNHKDPNGNTINLYELLDETRARYNFLQTCMDIIKFKSSSLITVNGALKIESNM